MNVSQAIPRTYEMMAKNNVETTIVCCLQFMLKISWPAKEDNDAGSYWFEVVNLRCSAMSTPDSKTTKDK